MLHTKYRPTKLSEIVGMGEMVAALEGAVKSPERARSYLFTGPAGCGKTTLARILAIEFGCGDSVTEVNAANVRGIDAMRDVIASVQTRPLIGQAKAIILDEAHRLTPDAQECLLKPVEEPPTHAYFFFCSTEPERIIPTIRSRCQTYEVRPLMEPEMKELLSRVYKAEKMEHLTPEVATAIIQHARGVPRHALIALEQTAQVGDASRAIELLKYGLIEEPAEVIELCRMLAGMQPPEWEYVAVLVKNLKTDPEKVRIALLNYLARCLESARGPQAVPRIMRMMEFVGEPYRRAGTARAELTYAVAGMLLAAQAG